MPETPARSFDAVLFDKDGTLFDLPRHEAWARSFLMRITGSRIGPRRG